MKASQFNIFFVYESTQVGFNSLSREYIIIDPILYELYNNGLLRNDFSELEVIHSEFYGFLIDQGFLVDSGLDEFELVKELSKSVDNDSSNFELIINPTMNCNFKCWYCYETHIKDSKMSEDMIKSAINLSNNIIANQAGLKCFTLSFFGGEPLLYFHKVIKPILISVHSNCLKNNIIFQCGMTTNGLLLSQEILDICSAYGLNSFQITLDGNREQHNKVRFISEEKGSYDKIVSNIILAVKRGLNVNLRINCSPETMVNLHEIRSEFEELTESQLKFLHFNLHKVWQVQEDMENKLDESRSFFQDSGFMVHSGDFDTVFSSCYGDKRYQATLNYNGEVFKCTARDFKVDSGEGMLEGDGSIIWNDRYEKRLNSKFNNPPCKECRILPLCGGGCSQQALEHEGVDYCIYNFDEDSKIKQVIRKFSTIISNLELNTQ